MSIAKPGRFSSRTHPPRRERRKGDRTPTPRSSSTPTPRLASGSGAPGTFPPAAAAGAGAGAGGAPPTCSSQAQYLRRTRKRRPLMSRSRVTRTVTRRGLPRRRRPPRGGTGFPRARIVPRAMAGSPRLRGGVRGVRVFRIEAAAAKSSTRELAEIHRAACAALRDPLDPDAARVGGGAEDEENGKNETETSAPFRALPRRWLARWRAFAFAKGANRRARQARWAAPRRRGAPASVAPRGDRRALLPPRGPPRRRPVPAATEDETALADDDDAAALDAEKTRVLRAIFGDGPPRTNEPTTTHDKKRTTTGDDRDILSVSSRLELELVPAAAAAALGGDAGRARPRAGVLPVGTRGAWAFAPAACAARASATERSAPPKVLKGFPSAVPRIPPYVSQAVSVRRVRVSRRRSRAPSPTAPRRSAPNARVLSRKKMSPPRRRTRST